MPSVAVYTTMLCGYCAAAKRLLGERKVPFEEIDVTFDAAARDAMTARAGGRRTVPQIFVGDRHVGGYDELVALDRSGGLDELSREPTPAR